MRVLRLGLGDGGFVDLHPSTSVVAGLSEHQRRSLRRSFGAVGAGLAPGADGLIESHGVLLDATQADLDLLEVPLTPARTVATVAEIPGAVPADDAGRLGIAERDVLLLAADRWRSWQALAHAEVVAARPTRASLLERAAALRERIGRHEARDAEPVRAALDAVRDQQRAGAPPDSERLVAALADVGLGVADLGLPLGESVRIAEDWLDERRREAAWAVGAGVELRGIDASLEVPEDDLVHVDVDELEELRRRARRAADAHAEAVDRAHEVRALLTERHHPRPTPIDIEQHLAGRLQEHRPDRLAGTVPLLLDGVLGHLDGPDVVALLDRIDALAGGVQLVVVDDHPAAGEWAHGAGPRRAAVVTPSPASTEGELR